MNRKPKDFNDYFSSFPPETKEILEQMRNIISKAAPAAEEIISYAMPAYRLHGNLVYFAAYKNHLGFYPSSSGVKAFEKELEGYKWSKGAIQFPLDKPLPVKLITTIVKFRVKENTEKAKLKKKR